MIKKQPRRRSHRKGGLLDFYRQIRQIKKAKDADADCDDAALLTKTLHDGKQERTYTFSLSDKISKGGYSYVFKATVPSSQGQIETVAIKCNKKKLKTNEANNLSNEIEILQKIKEEQQRTPRAEGSEYFQTFHSAYVYKNGDPIPIKDINVNKSRKQPRFISVEAEQIAKQTFRVPEDEYDYEIITEYCETDLYDHIREKGPLPEHEAKTIMKQLLQGLHFLQSIGIIHRDIKPENILIRSKNDDGTVKKICIIDVGLAKITTTKRANSIVGTLPFMAPELELRSGFYDGRKVDVWNAGVVLLLILTNYKKALPDTVTQETNTFLSYILNANPDDRPTAQDCLGHPWFSGLLAPPLPPPPLAPPLPPPPPPQS